MEKTKIIDKTTDEQYLADRIIKDLRSEDRIIIKVVKQKGKSIQYSKILSEYIT